MTEKAATKHLLLLLLTFAALAGLCQPRVFRNLTVQQGLPQNSVQAIAQDKNGFIWFGTRYGLSRYDGIRFKNYTNDPSDSTSIPGNQVSVLLKDSRGNLWIICNSQLCRYNEKFDNFTRIPFRETNTPQPDYSSIDCLFEDKDRHLWIGTRGGVVVGTGEEKINFKNKFRLINKEQTIGYYTNCIFQSSDGNMWIGTSRGLIRLKYESGEISDYQLYTHEPGNAASITGNHITAISEDKDHRLWVGTQEEGLTILEKQSGTWQRTEIPPLNNPVFNGKNLRELVPDQQGNMWIGSQNGLIFYDAATKILTNHLHDPGNKTSLTNNSVHCIYHDDNGTTWIGTYHGGVNITYRYRTNFQVYRNENYPNSINNDVVSSVVEDNQQNLWIGTEGGGLQHLNRLTGRFRNFRHQPGNNNSLTNNFVKCVSIDRNGNIWMGLSFNGGIEMYNPQTNRFTHYTPPGSNNRDKVNFEEVVALQEAVNGNIIVGARSGMYEIEKRSDDSYNPGWVKYQPWDTFAGKSVQSLFIDSRHNLWIGGMSGLYRQRSRDGKIIRYGKHTHADSLHEYNINFITEDTHKNIWIGTYYGGLYQFNEQQNSFTNYTQRNGLPNNNILGLLEDAAGQYWISTDNGLSRLNLATKKITNYTVSDGLPGNRFNKSAFFKNNKGELFFGGDNGLTAFFPEHIQQNKCTGPIVFTSLKLAGNTVTIADASVLLQQSITSTKKLVFKHQQSQFTIDFALLNFVKPEKNRYAYKLAGFEEHWNQVTDPSATYSSLPAGSYTFMVKAANNDGYWTEPASIKIEILPPLWKTGWAYTLYILVFLLGAFLLVRFFYLRALFKKELTLQQFKLNFFANISHEIRTHLTLISGPVEKLLVAAKDNMSFTRQLEHVKDNADRLSTLINELMDFRKVETHNLQLHVSRENIISFTNDIVRSFSDLSDARDITLTFTAPPDPVWIYFDKRQLEKVIFNLLTNAFKFTPNQGRIQVEIREHITEAEILVTDNGKGIAPENVKRIFTNFFQVEEETTHNTGYGIGLALSKSLVDLHQGNLSVESHLSRGAGQPGRTCFKIALLKGSTHFAADQLTKIAPASLPRVHTIATELPATSPAESPKPAILLVEDNTELLSFLQETLSPDYEVSVATNGQKGWQTATEQIPDLVISDVMMPEMDGYLLCEKLKTDQRTSHIPVILLTARSTTENKVTGLEKGADIYISKPFSLRTLELHISNLIRSRTVMQEKYSRQIMLEPQQVEINNLDEQFLTRLMEIIEEHIDDEDFGVTLLSQKAGMSKPVLYKKLKALTNMTANDFIKHIRLKKAEKLLASGKLTVAEVAYMVGFTRREHFSDEFKKQFGKTPTDYLKGIVPN